MRYFQISVLITALFLCLLSCRETIGEQHKPVPKENTAPPRQRKMESPVKQDSLVTPLKAPQDKEKKKKKKKATDTLRPKVAVL